MNNCCRETRGEDDYSFFAWILIICVLYWTTVDVMYYRKVYRLFMKTLADIYSISEAIIEYTADDNNALIVKLSIVKDNTSRIEMGPMEAVREVYVGILVSMYLFIWQYGNNSQLTSSRDAENIATMFMTQDMNMMTSQLLFLFIESIEPDELEDVTRKHSNISEDMHFSPALRLLAVLHERLRLMHMSGASTQDGQSILMEISQINNRFETARHSLHEYELALETAPSRWLSIIIKIVGLLLVYTFPPIFYATMGNKILYIGPILFMVVGSFVLFNTCQSNIFRFHTSMHMGKTYDYMNIITLRMQNAFVKKFKTSIDAQIKAIALADNQKTYIVINPFRSFLCDISNYFIGTAYRYREPKSKPYNIQLYKNT